MPTMSVHGRGRYGTLPLTYSLRYQISLSGPLVASLSVRRRTSLSLYLLFTFSLVLRIERAPVSLVDQICAMGHAVWCRLQTNNHITALARGSGPWAV